MNQDKKSAYLIELKGSNILYAMDQVISAEKLLKGDLSTYSIFYRIIYRSRTQEVRKSRIIRWREKEGKRDGIPIVILKEKQLEESIEIGWKNKIDTYLKSGDISFFDSKRDAEGLWCIVR